MLQLDIFKQTSVPEMENYQPLFALPPDVDERIVLIASASPDSGYQSPPGKLHGPYLEILEEPVDRFRFRYKSEMAGTHGSLNGCRSDKSRKQSHPTVQLSNFNGECAIIRCMLYQHDATDQDDHPHAHRLVKKIGTDEVDDPHEMEVSVDNGYTAVFQNMGIIHTAKKNVLTELVRKKTQLKLEDIIRVEHYERGLTKKEELEIKSQAEEESKFINLNMVCLRFDAFVRKGKMLIPLCPPVYSQTINNLKSAMTGELKIVRMDHCTSPSNGGKEIFILVEKVMKKNIRIRFYEEDDDNNCIWEGYGKFNDLDVHHQYAIVFKTPPYKDPYISKRVNVFMELERPSDNARSEPKQFTYIPTDIKSGKRMRPTDSSSSFESSREYTIPATVHDISENRSVSSSLNLDVLSKKVDSAELDETFRKYLLAGGFENVLQDYSLMDTSITDIQMDSPKTKTDSPAMREKEATDYCEKVFKQLSIMVKTRPTQQKLKINIDRYFDPENIDAHNQINPLHIAIVNQKQHIVSFFIKLIKGVYRTNDTLLNRGDRQKQTALHYAAVCNNSEAVEELLNAGADPKIQDVEGNTALHLAVKKNSINVTQCLLIRNPEFIVDIPNNDGDTALMLAIKNNNLDCVIILCRRGANVNQGNKKDGFTPLRMAVDKHNEPIVKYLLNNTSANGLQKDYNNRSPFDVAKRLQDSNREARQVYALIEEYMRSEGIIPSDVQIKEEMESSEEEMEVDEDAVKSEPVCPEELKKLYANRTTFIPEYLDQLCNELDSTGGWEDLVELLDLGVLLRGTELFEKHPTKTLLNLVMMKGEPLFQIREFLEILDQSAAVKIMDNMVLRDS